MFNIGGDDKEKLEENMEEIKNLISSDQNNQKQQQNEEKEGGNSLKNISEADNNQEFEESISEGFSEIEEEEEESQAENLQANNLEQGQNTELEQPQDETSLQEPQNISTGVQEDSSNSRNQPEQLPQNNQSRDSQNRKNNSTPQQPQEDVRELQNQIKDQINSLEKESRRQEGSTSSQNKSEEEPLFLEVERFEDIRDMVEEMHYLTTEMDDVMESLAAGIQKDQETAGEANQIVGEFQARRDKIEQILRDN